MDIKYPEIRKQLIALDKDDQDDIRGHYQRLQDCKTRKQKHNLQYQLALRCHRRAQHMLVLLDKIQKAPTVSNIGIDGSQAVSLLALHSYLDVMKQMLLLYENFYKKEAGNIYYQAIPPLTDRIMILEKKKQRFGTNWFADRQGKLFLIQVEDFPSMNDKRARYGLGSAEKPRILSYGAKERPLGVGLAAKNDQKPLTDQEYKEYAQFQLSSLPEG